MKASENCPCTPSTVHRIQWIPQSFTLYMPNDFFQIDLKSQIWGPAYATFLVILVRITSAAKDSFGNVST